MVRNLQNKFKTSSKGFFLKFAGILMLFGVFSSNLYATHMMGADITYYCLGNNKFNIIIKLYRDCRGVSIGAPGSTISCASNNNTIASFTPTEIKVRDITPTCSSTGKACSPPNTYGTGKGIEEHTYSYTYDFTTARKNGCCRVRIGTGQCCRNGAITTGAASANFYTYAEFDICTSKCNSSPSLTTEPIALICCNQPYYYNNGASDTTDLDSLSYEWGDPLTSYGAKTSWSGAFSSKMPFSVYWPSGYDKSKGPKPDATPPIGLYLDPETGDLIFTPTDCNESTVAVIQVTEWRKDSTGKWKDIGVTRRDVQFWVETCPGNNPPILNGPYKYDVCAGNAICFTITSDDKQFIPPPPAKANPPDTVRLTWNRGIPGGTFNIVNAKARLQSGKFCWTPKKSQASDLPYTFTVTARDNSCPLNAVTVKSYSVKVKHIAEAERDIDTFACGKYSIESNPFPNFKGAPSYFWEITDTNNQVLNKSYYYFTTGNSLYSNKKADTIQFRKGGKYLIHHRINNPPLNCPTDYFDTLVVPPLLEVDLALGPDTFVCAGTTLKLGTRAANGLPPFKYKWYTPDSTNAKDTMSYLDVFMSTHDTMFRVLITDKNKCTAFDTVQVFLKPNPKVDMGPDLRICWYNSVTIIPDASNAYWIDPNNGDTLTQGDTLWWQWKYNGNDFSTDTIASYAQEGIYNVTVTDSLGCTWTDTMNLYVNDTIKPFAGPDQIKCFNDTLVLTAQGLDTFGTGKVGTYIWWKDIPIAPPEFSRKQTLKFLAKTTTTYALEVRTKEDTTLCFAYDTMLVNVNPLPTLTLIPPQKYCCDYGNIALGSSTFGSPTGGDWKCRQVPAYVSSNVFLTDDACDPNKAGIFTLIYTYQDPGTTCINKDSTRFTINPLPPLNLKGGYYCQDKIEAPLKPHILAPLNLNSMVQANWRLLRSLSKPGGGLNTISDLVYDADGSMNYDFRLKVDKGTIDLGSEDRDSIVLELTIMDGEGCFNKDTMVIYIWKIPVITFNAFPDLCIDEGTVNLIKLSNTKPDDGYWTVVNKAGYCDSARLRPGLTAPDTLNTNKLSPQLGPCTYWMRYIHTSSGCPVQKDTMLRINPLPTVNISITPSGNFGRFCEIDPDVTLNASPSGGTWTSTVPGALGAGIFKPTAVQAADRDKWITLTYTYVHPTTKCDTSKSLRVFVQSKPVIDIVTPDIDTCRTNVMDFNLTATYAFTSKISWVHSAGSVRGDFATQQLSNANPVTYTLRPRGDSATKVVVTAFTENEGECPFASDYMIIDVNPIPHATIAIDDPDGCQPHTANFKTTITNGINPTTATYQWDFGDTGTGSTQDATHIFNNVGTNNVKITITSDKGCDTTIGPMNIDVYPNPVADFTPNPNNSTTAALPRFRFTDQTELQSVLGSKLVSHYWDFGDLNITTDTSTQTNPEYYYTSDTGVYYVTHTVVTNHGCRDSITKPVIIGPDILVYIPNVFSPDGAGPLKNDKFWVIASGFTTYQIIIFDRWGEVLYKSTKLEEPWDGNYKGLPCQMDAYVYQVNITSFSGELYKYNGTVILLR